MLCLIPIPLGFRCSCLVRKPERFRLVLEFTGLPVSQDSWTRSSLNGVALGLGSLRSGVFTSIGDSFANFYHLIVELRSELILSDFVVGLFDGRECVLFAAVTEVNNRGSAQPLAASLYC